MQLQFQNFPNYLFMQLQFFFLPELILHKYSVEGYIYYGDAASFHDWDVRTRLHIAGKTGGQYIEAMSKVCDGLRGDVFVVAQEVGFDNVCDTTPPKINSNKFGVLLEVASRFEIDVRRCENFFERFEFLVRSKFNHIQ